MKNPILSAIALVFISCQKNDDVKQSSCNFTGYKYYKGKQDNLGALQNNYILIGVDTTYSDSQIKNFISTLHQSDQSYDYTIRSSAQYKFKEIPLRLKASRTCEQITQMISELEQNAIVSYVHYTMKAGNCEDFIGQQIGNLCIYSYRSNFYVKVVDANDLKALNQKIAETNTELVKQLKLMPEVFELRATKNSKGDA